MAFCCNCVAVQVPEEPTDKAAQSSSAAGEDSSPRGLFGKTPAELAHLRLQVVSACGFAGFNIGLNYFNKWALTPPPASPGFNVPVFYTMCTMVTSALGVSLLMWFVPPATGWPSWAQFWDYKLLLVLNSTCTTLNLTMNNASLTLISLFLNQVIKATAPAITVPLSALVEGKRYGWGVILSVALIVTGTILAVPQNGHGGVQTSGAGVVLVIISTLSASTKSIVMSVAMRGSAERPKLGPTAVMFYDCCVAFFFMLVYWLASNERERTIDYLGQHAGWGIGIILGGGAMAFCFNVSTYYFVLSTSALTSAVGSNGVKVFSLPPRPSLHVTST